jgi:hypothetical protein
MSGARSALAADHRGHRRITDPADPTRTILGRGREARRRAGGAALIIGIAMIKAEGAAATSAFGGAGAPVT